MKILRALVSRYFHAWWPPALLAILSLGLCLGTASLPAVTMPQWIPSIFFVLFLVSLAGMAAAVIFRLIKKRWGPALGQASLAAVILCLGGFGVIFLWLFFSFSGPSADGFADHLSIPEGIPIEMPRESVSDPSEAARDEFQAAIHSALAKPGNDDASITADVPSLAELQRKAPDILKRYLATSIAWRVYEERGGLFATRRWAEGGEWIFSLHGYYSSFEVSDGGDSGNFQTRLSIGLSGRPWAGRRGATDLRPGLPAKVALEKGNGLKESLCLLPVGGLVVEIFEQSTANERLITKASLKFLEEELKPLAQSPTWETIQKIVPPGSIATGEPSLRLRDGMQPGIYEAVIRANPGEPGFIYLKAFEITKGTALSKDDLRATSNEYIGWSDNPSQQFFSNTNITIYEGDWGKPYAARFEVWFVPSSGKPERKLLEKNFQIEGWQR